MRFREGQYLLFGKCVAKVNKIEREFRTIKRIKLRKFSKGNTRLGYSYQQYVSLQHLTKLCNTNKARVIPPEEVMQCLLANFEGCFPIKDMRYV